MAVLTPTTPPPRRHLQDDSIFAGLDPIQATFDDDRAVVFAGLVSTGTLIGRLGLERAVDDKINRGYRLDASY